MSSCSVRNLAHVATDLEVLEENYHEYIKVSHPKFPTLWPVLCCWHDFLFLFTVITYKQPNLFFLLFFHFLAGGAKFGHQVSHGAV